MSIEAAERVLGKFEQEPEFGPRTPAADVVKAIIAAWAGDRVLLTQELCIHGNEYRHKGKPDHDCTECGGNGRVTGHSGSDAYTDDCFCVSICQGGRLVQVWPSTDPTGGT